MAPAPPNMPAPMPARRALTESSALASSTSWRTSRVVWSERSRTRSPTGRSVPFVAAMRSGLPGRRRAETPEQAFRSEVVVDDPDLRGGGAEDRADRPVEGEVDGLLGLGLHEV